MQTAVEIPGPDGSLRGEIFLPVLATHMLILAHGAGAGFDHANMIGIANAMADLRIATLRFNFPYMQAGRRRTDSKDVAVAAIAAAVDLAATVSDLPLLAGGHSFGGRMASHMAAEKTAQVQGLVFCSFPLHPANKPAVIRAAHLHQIMLPMLFLSGTRDALAERDLLVQTVAATGAQGQLHWLETSDHSYRILKRQRAPEPTVFEEMAVVTRAFVDRRC